MGPGFESLKVHQRQVAAAKLDFRIRKGRTESPKMRFDRVAEIDVVSVSNAKGPPVPIPNTEVKLCSAENTCLETNRKDRSTLTYQKCLCIFEWQERLRSCKSRLF